MRERKVPPVAETHAKRNESSAAAPLQASEIARKPGHWRRGLGIGIDRRWLRRGLFLRTAEQKVKDTGTRGARRRDKQSRGQRRKQNGGVPFQSFVATGEHYGKTSQPARHAIGTRREARSFHRSATMTTESFKIVRREGSTLR
jgi:hypothetical protein